VGFVCPVVNEKMKALVIAPQPFFSPRGTPFSVYYRTLITSELGVKIDLLTYGEGHDVDIPGVRIVRIPRFPFFGPVKIGPSYLKLFLDIFLVIWTIALLLKNRYYFVHAHEEAVFFCRFLKPIFGFELVYDMHSSLPQQLTNFQFTESKFLIKIFKGLEDSCLHAVDVVITICPDLASYVKNIIQNNEKHFLIENSIFEPVKLRSSAAADYSPIVSFFDKAGEPFTPPSEKKLIVYAGTLEPYQGIDILLKAFQLVFDEFSNAFLLIVGGNSEQVAHYSNLASKNGIKEDTHFTGQVEQELAKYYCGLASVLVSPRTEGSNTPLKVYEQLASGIPLVATNIYSHTQVLNNDVAILVEPEPNDMARGILRTLRSDDGVKQITENAKRYYQENYSRPIYEAKMRRVLEILSS
jgi:glycosyltransferase involved in cell wall biosynthesis